MLSYAIKRIGLAVLIIFVVMLAMYAMVFLVPGDPASLALGPRATPELKHALMERMGKTQDPAERERLMAEHMRLMNESMTMMGSMMRGPASGQDARKVMDALAAAGIDFEDVNRTLEREGIDKFVKSYDSLLGVIAQKRRALAR